MRVRIVILSTARTSAALVTARTFVIPAVSVLTTVIAAWSFVTLWPWPALRLDVAFRFFDKSPAGESHLAGLLSDFEEFYINLVANVEDIFNFVSLAPVNL